MKTDKFEKTIRRKLESIEPEFHENDWTKMQNFMQANTPPTFWQQYSSWFGYAAAAAVSSVMVFLYVNQLSQNNTLLSDVKTLQNQIETIKNTPTVIQKTDTVYVVQQQVIEKPVYDKQISNQEEQRFIPQQNESQESLASSDENQKTEVGNNTDPGSKPDGKSVEEVNLNPSLNSKNEVLAGNSQPENVRNSVDSNGSQSPGKSRNDGIGKNSVTINSNSSVALNGNTISTNGNNNPITKGTNNSASGNTGRNSGSNGNGNFGNGNSMVDNNAGNQKNLPVYTAKTLDEKFDQLEVKAPVGQTNYTALSRKMNYGLAHRISPKQVRNVLLAANPPKIQEETKNVESNKKVESAKKTETTIPRFNLKVPYRFGIAQQWEGKNQVKTVIGEVLVSKNFSVSTGVSWVKIKPEQFNSEKSYNDKNRSDFKKDHFLPMALKVINMKIKSSLMQIPINVAFRKNIGEGLSYFVGAGTNITLSSKRDIAYDCFFNSSPRPGPDIYFQNERASEKIDLKLFNSVNFSAGIEKSFHPVVVQAEGYLYSYFNPISPQATKTGPGFKIKLLYQIGKKM
ncbi:hypothetical protein [Dyadobacter sp. CY356]|uniref:hypothetical protein n=1 Tax=Dyadobacter sp. CY356 TaxID=2906442 RepID=UPI001F474304|nr:hypothetical protein [Dyadobacter sp. CY356]MCF0058267.1 hypothetical protein [Dyadobacter sp. CY356]